jgi:hypothetical protein
LQCLTHGNEGVGYAFSAETGKRFAVGNGWSLTPQAQLSYSKAEFDRFTDRFGAPVSLRDGDSLLGRAGLALNHRKTNDGAGIVRSDIYGIATCATSSSTTPVSMSPVPASPARKTGYGAASAAVPIAGPTAATPSSARSHIARALKTRQRTTATRALAAFASSGDPCTRPLESGPRIALSAVGNLRIVNSMRPSAVGR